MLQGVETDDDIDRGIIQHEGLIAGNRECAIGNSTLFQTLLSKGHHVC
jgi:hypothetical protein